MPPVGTRAFVKKAVLFDLYGTLIDIKTDERDPSVYEVLSGFLSYHGVIVTPDDLMAAFFSGVRKGLEESSEVFPEIDVVRVFEEILFRFSGRRHPHAVVVDAVMLFRSLTIRRFGAIPNIYEALSSMASRFRLAIVSDAQWAFTDPEMGRLGLHRLFPVRILSSRQGFKKPDTRLFLMALERLRVRPENAVYVGDNPLKDMPGPKRLGMKFILCRATQDRLEGFEPDASFRDYRELPDILAGCL